ncbi:hypothetical protein HY004_01585 [Candidatus Saccharibacteria bacterium]|nr:hypothetical protein [Candidatus Saccharibacteria bacterium]
MKLAVAHFPKGKVNNLTLFTSYGLSAIIIAMVVAQLMTIEKLLPIIENYQLPGGSPSAKIIIFLSATCGVFALPFLLRMNLSPLFRILSALLLNVYALIWLGLGLWITVNNPPLIGTGLFGGLLKSIPGEVVLPFGSLLFVGTVFITWSLRSDLGLKK